MKIFLLSYFSLFLVCSAAVPMSLGQPLPSYDVGGASQPKPDMSFRKENQYKRVHQSSLRHILHLIDLMATCLDAAHAKYPEEYLGNPITSLEGKSLLPVFGGNSLNRELIFFEHEGNRALRMGDWKIVAKGKPGQYDVKWELFNINKDRSALHNLATEQPDRLEKMKTLWTSKAGNVQAIPRPKPKPKQKKSK